MGGEDLALTAGMGGKHTNNHKAVCVAPNYLQ